jgi:hypothetical protein
VSCSLLLLAARSGMCCAVTAIGYFIATAMNLAAGEKLSESNALDVRELCNTLLNCYLTQVGSSSHGACLQLATLCILCAMAFQCQY